jgi:hypothetical protein
MWADTYSLIVSGAGLSSRPVCIEISAAEIEGSQKGVGHKIAHRGCEEDDWRIAREDR